MVSHPYIPPVKPSGPPRKAQLIRATIRLLLRDGLSGVNHKSVSEEAKLPINATTYYFSSLDSLISETFQALYTAHLSAPSLELQSGGGSKIDDIVDALFLSANERLEANQVLYELHLLAGRRQDLRVFASLSWERASEDLQHYLGVSDETARAITSLIDGYMLSALATHYLPNRAYVREIFAHMVELDARRSSFPKGENTKG